jgi:hypothetical protein
MSLDKERFREVLKSIDPLNRNYFREWVVWQTGCDILKLSSMKPQDANEFLEIFFVCAAINFSGQRGGAGGIDNVHEGLLGFRKAIKLLESLYPSQYHNISVFVNKLDIKPDKNLTPCQQLVNFMEKQKTFGPKIAALFVKILVKDLEFFGPFGNIAQPMFVPLDKVNARLCNHLLKQMGIKLNILLDDISDNDMKGRRERHKFNRIARYIMGCQSGIYFENLWFIGHFYHFIGAKAKQDCCINEIQLQAEMPVTKKLSFPCECPLKKIGCLQLCELGGSS